MSQCSACCFKANNVNYIDKTSKKNASDFICLWLTNHTLHWDWRTGTIQPGSFGSSWKGHLIWNTCVTPLLGIDSTAPGAPLFSDEWHSHPFSISVDPCGASCWSNFPILHLCRKPVWEVPGLGSKLYPAFISWTTSGIIQLDPCLVEKRVWTWGSRLKINRSAVCWWKKRHRQKRENRLKM